MKKLKSILIWPWPLWSCLISGSLAEVFHCPEIWGAGNRFVSYATPFPVASGTFHLPALLATSALLYAHLAKPRRWQRVALLAILGASLLLMLTVTLLQLRHMAQPHVGTRSFDFQILVQVFVWTMVDPIIALVITLLPKGKVHNKVLDATSL